MHANSKFRLIKMFLFFFVFVTFCGSIFFVLYNNNLNKNNTQPNNETQTTLSTDTQSTDVNSPSLLGDDDTAQAGTGDDVAEAGFEASFYIKASHCSISVEWEMNYVDWDIIGSIDQDPEKGSTTVSFGDEEEKKIKSYDKTGMWYGSFRNWKITFTSVTVEAGYYCTNYDDLPTSQTEYGNNPTIELKTAVRTYNVYFNANDGSGSVSPMSFTGTNSITLPSGSQFSWDGHSFTGYSESSDANSPRKRGGATYSAWGSSGAATAASTATRTLYVIWANVITLVDVVADVDYNGYTTNQVRYIYECSGYGGYYYDSECRTNSVQADESFPDEMESVLKLNNIPTDTELNYTLGYSTFNGYYTDQNGGTKKIDKDGKWSFGSSGVLSGQPTTLYAQYSNPKSFTLTINAAGGTIAQTQYTGVYKQSITINEPTRAGYKFDIEKGISGWEKGSGQLGVINSSTQFTFGASDVTLTAQWTANTYKFTLDNQSATTEGTKEAYYKYNTAVYYSNAACTTQLSNNKITPPAKTGYTFGGYYTQQNGVDTPYINNEGNFVNNAQNVLGDISNNNTTLYAYWKPTWTLYAAYNTAQYLTTYTQGAVGGTVSAGSDGASPNETYTYVEDSVSNTSRNCYASAAMGYEFVGWYTALNGGTRISTNNPANLGNGTYYAHFNVLSYEVNIIWNKPDSTDDSYGDISASGQNNGAATTTATSYTQEYYYGASVTLTAQENSNYGHFDCFEGEFYSTDPSHEFTMPAKKVTIFGIFIPVWSNQVISVEINQTYTGEEFTPSNLNSAVTVTDTINNKTLSNYQIVSINQDPDSPNNWNVGSKNTATIRYTGDSADYWQNGSEIEVPFNISPRPIQDNTGGFTFIVQPNQVYTGSELTPNLPEAVYNGHYMLEGTDYELSYNNNINAGVDTAEITITGIGNYTDSITKNFAIERASLSFVDAQAAKTFTYNNKKISPTNFVASTSGQQNDITVTYDGFGLYSAGNLKYLAKGTDFTISEISDQDYVNVGTKYLTLTGIGNYINSITVAFEIVPKNLSDADTTNSTLADGTVVYNGATPLTDANGVYQLYNNNVGQVVYRGVAFVPTFNNITLKYTYQNISFSSGDYTLVGGTDYTIISVTNNLNIGEAEVVIEGTGNFVGERILHFEIHKKNIAVFSLDKTSVEYNNAVQKPNLNDDGLIKFEYTSGLSYAGLPTTQTGVDNYTNYQNYIDAVGDYVITYYANKNTGTQGHWESGKNSFSGVDFQNADTYIILIYATQKGNYEGALRLEYKITPRNAASLVINLSKTTTTYNGDYQKPTITISYNGGEVLDTDCNITLTGDNISNSIVLYVSQIPSVADYWKNAGSVTLQLGKVAGAENYSGTFPSATFTISPLSISTAQLTTPTGATYIYNGKQWGSENAIQFSSVIVEGLVLENPTDYTIATLQSGANINAGDASITLNGVGNFTDTKTFEFTITPREIAQAGISLSPVSAVYSGVRQEPNLQAIDLTNGIFSFAQDSTITYIRGGTGSSNINTVDCTNAGTITINIEGKHNYYGNLILTYTITQVQILGYSYTYTDGTTTATTEAQNASPIYSGSAYQIVKVFVKVQGIDEAIEYTVGSSAFANAFSFVYSQMATGGTVTGNEVDFVNAYAEPITLTLTSLSSNYVQNNLTGVFDIQPASISIVKNNLVAIPNQTYTGSAIVPTLQFSTGIIVADDYYLTFPSSNNINAGIANLRVNAALNRNFTGYFDTTFIIDPKSINGADIYTVLASYEYNGQEQKPSINYIALDDRNVYATNLNIVYARTDNVKPSSDFVQVGSFSITITHKDVNNYVGQVSAIYQIVQKKLTLNNIVWGADVYFNAYRQEPTITITDNLASVGNIIRADDYDLEFVRNGYSTHQVTDINLNLKDAGEIVIYITAPSTSNYYIKDENNANATHFSHTYKILPKDLSQAIVVFDTMVYNGSAQTPTFTVTDNDILVEGNNYILRYEDSYKDYTYIIDSRSELTNAHQNGGYITITGTGNFTGTKEVTFSILPKNIADASISVDINPYAYTGQPIIPSGENVSIVDSVRSTSLTSPNEYTLLIAEGEDNISKGEVGVVITGYGNYTGTRAESFFIIEVHINAENTMTIKLREDEFTFDNTAHQPYVQSITINLSTGEHLVYIPDITEIEYIYTGAGTLSAQQMYVYSGNYAVKFVPNNGNYVIDAGFENTYNQPYVINKKEITADMFNISYAEGVVYDGTSKKAAVSANYNGFAMVQNTDYMVVYYRGVNQISNDADFINAGTITLYINSNSARNYTGTLDSLSYQINPKSISGVSINRLGLNDIFYTGNIASPLVSVIDSAIIVEGNPKVLVKYDSSLNNGATADYKIDYIDAVNASTNAKIVVTGMNNYNSATTATLIFEIKKAQLDDIMLSSNNLVYNRTAQNIGVDSISTNTIATPNLIDDVEYSYYREGITTTDLTSAGLITIRATAKATSTNFAGFAEKGFTISPAVIDANGVLLNTTSAVYDARPQTSKIYQTVTVDGNNVQKLLGSVLTQNNLSLQAGEYTISLSHDNPLDSSYTIPGNITVTVNASSPNFTGSASAVFVINKKTLNDASTIKVLFYYVDASGNPVDASGNPVSNKEYVDSQYYEGKTVEPEVRYYFAGNLNGSFLVLNKNTQYTYTQVPSNWQNANNIVITIIASANGFYTDSVECIFQVKPLPWNTTDIEIVIQAQTYTGQNIVFDSTNASSISAHDKTNNKPLTFGTDFEVYTEDPNTHQPYTDAAGNEYVGGYLSNLNAGAAFVLFKSSDSNYGSGFILVEFQILPRNINDNSSGSFEFVYDSTSYTYDKQSHLPQLTTAVYHFNNGVDSYDLTLNATNTDYTLSYLDSLGQPITPVDAGDYSVVITGTGNYTGTISTNYRINKKDISTLDISFANTGAVFKENTTQKPQTIVYYEVDPNTSLGFNLVENEDYTISYEYANFLDNTYNAITSADANFINAGSYKLTISASGNNYINSAIITFTIDRDILTQITLSANSVTYNKTAQTPSIMVVAQNNPAVTLVNLTYQKQEGANFVDVVTPDYTNAGTVRIIANALNNQNYTGLVYADFVIEPKLITQSMITLTANFTYNATAQEATVVIVDDDDTLVPNTDYLLTYYNNTNASDSAEAQIVGKGNYTIGNPNLLTLYYTILPLDINNITFNQSAVQSVEYNGTNIALQQSNLNGVLVYNSYNLILNTDFIIEYANNARVDADTYNITLTGTNNYTGTKQAQFTISPINIHNNNNIVVNLSQTEFVYTGEEIKPIPTSIVNNLIATEDYISPINYSISWADNINVLWNDNPANPAEVAAARLIITGSHNYIGQKVVLFKILALDINSPLIVKTPSNIPVQKYKQGQPCTPTPVLTYNETQVAVTYSYTNNNFANENATVTITAVSGTNFKGSITLIFEIDVNNIQSATIIGIQDVVYNGQVQKLVPIVKDDDVTLTADNGNGTGQYSVEYQSARFGSNPDYTNVDTITLIITGQNGYKGSLSVSYKINPRTFTQADIQNNVLSVNGVEARTYNATAQTQNKNNIQLFIAENNLTIPQNCYDIEYTNNIDAGNAIMHFTFYNIIESTAQPNNYAGSFEYTFIINKLALSASMFSQSVPLDGFEYNGVGRTLDLLLVLPDASFTAESGKYSVLRYENNINVTRDLLGNVLENQAKAVVQALPDSNFTGTAEVLFTIKPKTADIHYYSPTLSIETQDIIYNGTVYTPTFTTMQDVLFGGELLADQDYIIVDYLDNLNASVASNAKIIVKFIQNYEGEVSFEFTILKRDILDVIITPDTLQNYIFDGQAHKQEVTLKYITADNQELLLDDANFVIEYIRTGVDEAYKYIYAGDITIQISATQSGNFTGTTTLSYTIQKLNIADIQCTLSSNTQDFLYTGNQITPSITIKYNDFVFTQNYDYSLTYGTNINVAYDSNNQVTNGGTITITSLSGNIQNGELTIDFAILPRNLEDIASITLSVDSMVYTGTNLLPSIIVFDDVLNKELVLGAEYSLSNSANIMPGDVTITAKGMGNYTGSLDKIFKILYRTFNQDDGITFSWVDNVANILYDHTYHTPNFTATYTKDGLNVLLEKDADFTINYNNNKNASTDTQKAILTITGINGYQGSYTATFEIKPYNVQNILSGKNLSSRKYDGTNKQPVIYSQLASFMVYLNQALIKDSDYTVEMVRISGEVIADQDFIDIGSFRLTVQGVGNYTGGAILTVSIVSKEIDNLLLIIDGATYYNSAQLQYRGFAYTLGIVARSTLEVVEQDGYTITYYNANDEELDANTIQLLNAGTIKVKVTGANNFMGECVSTITILPKNLTDSDIEVANFLEHINYYYGVEREQTNMMLYFNTQNNTRILLQPDIDYEVKYYNNAYSGRALMQIVGRGNYNPYERLSKVYYIDKIASIVNPYINNTTYFEGDWLPNINLLPSDTHGVIKWDTPTRLLLGTNDYSWTFIPTDASNYERVSGLISITAIEIVPIELLFEGDYKIEYYVFDAFNPSGLVVYLLYNNGKKVLLDESMYLLTIAAGQELYLNSVPSVVYNDGQHTITRAIQIDINKIPLTITYNGVDGLIQTEQSQYITPTITNEINSYTPGLIVRYYSHKLNAYTDGITQGGNYTISVVLVDEAFFIETGESIDIYVKTGIIKSNNGLVTIIDELGFDDDLSIVIREYNSVSQISGVLDFNTFNMKKFYEIQLWKNDELYTPTHSITIRINLGRDLLESSKITGYLIPANLQTAIALDYTINNRDNVEFKANQLGGFIFGEKVEAPNDVWWIFVVAGVVLAVLGAAIVVLIIIKRRKVKALTKSINLKLGK